MVGGAPAKRARELVMRCDSARASEKPSRDGRRARACGAVPRAGFLTSPRLLPLPRATGADCAAPDTDRLDA